jgi:aspartyl-tRNA(Asn)/glutamyl-tRNA(Gln) amidotransferase subunit A
MATAPRFPDWSSLSERDHAGAVERCRSRLSKIGRKLHAVGSEIEAASHGDGPLGGMPYVTKEMIATGVTAPNWGCRAPLEAVARPAAVVGRLADAGASLIGTSEMTELAYEPSGLNSVRGNVLNPWNFDIVPGGSSSGSAALVAAGCCFAALGSDTGGSVRIPAHCCGVTSLKPSWGSLPLDGTMKLAPSLDTIGVFARSAADVALVWRALSGQGATASSWPYAGVIFEDAFAVCDVEVAKICRRAIGVLADLGMRMQKRAGFPEEADRQVLLVMQAEAARVHAARLDDVRVDATLRKRLRKGLAITDDALATSVAAREAMRNDFLAHCLGDAAVALLPVMPIRTPYVGEVDPASPAFKAKTLYALSRFTRFVNYLGLPALAVPAGFDSRGMPVGLQIIGRPDNEALLIDMGRRLQSVTDWHGRVPTAIESDIAVEMGLAA